MLSKLISLHITDNNDNDVDLTSFSRLPDEIVLEIFNKVVDFKTLCVCQLLSKRFYLIVHQVDVISFNVPPFEFDFNDDRYPYFYPVSCLFSSEPFESSIESMNRFRCLKSLSIKLPFPSQEGFGADGDRYLFKSKVKLGNNRIDSFLFLSPNLISSHTDSNEVGQEDEYAVDRNKFHIAIFCLIWDAHSRSKLLFRLLTSFPLLEEVSITDSAKMLSVTLNGSKMVEMRKWRLSSSETEQKFNLPSYRTSMCYIPLLELPVSGYVMKDLTLFLMEKRDLPDGHDRFHNIFEEAAFEGKDEAAYNEAMTEIFKKHKGSIKRYI